MLEELARTWSIVLVRPEGGKSAAESGVNVLEEIVFPRTSRWMYLPSQYDTRPLVRSVSKAAQSHPPDVALLWSGMEYLKADIARLPRVVSDRVDCMTLSAWRQLKHSHGLLAARRRLGDLAETFRYERSVRKICDATVVVGEEDARALRRVVRASNVRVVPNGVASWDKAPVKRTQHPTVVFTGVMSYQPNVDAVHHFAREIWPSVRLRVPDARFQIVGRSPQPDIVALGSRPGIEVHADVESVHDYLARAWLSVAPMRSGAGLKNKVLESWSVGTPAAMTPIATNGLRSAPPELLVAAEGNRLANSICDLLNDSARREALGVLARRTAQQQFSWEAQAAQLDALLRTVAD
jgi:glycosyltransferase involved in cell wall biosynthesis